MSICKRCTRDDLPGASGHRSHPAPLSPGESWDGRNKSPQTGCLRTTGIFSLGEQLWGLEGGNQYHQAEARCQRGRGPPGSGGRSVACSSLAPGGRAPLARAAPSDLSVCTQMASSSSLQNTSFLPPSSKGRWPCLGLVPTVQDNLTFPDLSLKTVRAPLSVLRRDDRPQGWDSTSSGQL